METHRNRVRPIFKHLRSKVMVHLRERIQAFTCGLDPFSLTVDTPIPFSLKRLWYQLTDFEKKTFTGPNRDVPALLNAGNENLLVEPTYQPHAMGGCWTILKLSCKRYLIATITVNDFDAYMGNYGSVAIPAIIAAGGEILVGTPEVSVLESEYVHNWTVVVRFPSEEAAYNWYNSPEYQAVIPIRHSLTNTETAVMILAPQFQPPE